jgi:hypothetical protein
MVGPLSKYKVPLYDGVKWEVKNVVREVFQGIDVSTKKTMRANRIRGTAKSKGNFGGRDRGRTGDLIVANDALSQLSYSPTSSKEILTRVVEVGNLRFEVRGSSTEAERAEQRDKRVGTEG